MITLVTGLPGSGKTLYSLSMVNDLAEKEARPVFYNGITDLTLPWTLWDDDLVKRWHLLPNGSAFSADTPLLHKGAVIVIDECQRLFRVRPAGSPVPDFVAALERHRHQGLDFVLITQHPMLIDSNVRRLAGRHLHAVSAFGAKACTLHEWASVKDQCDKQRSDSIKHLFKYPREVYHWYKSAEVHTHKRRIPAKFVFLVLVPLLVAALVYGVVRFLSARSEKNMPAPLASADKSLLSVNHPRDAKQGYLESYVPVIPGLPHTAPRYEALVVPKVAPYPSGCISSSKSCKCYSEQATVINVSPEICAGIVKNGYFREWEPALQASSETRSRAGSSGADEKPLAGNLSEKPVVANQSGETWSGIPSDLPPGPMPPGVVRKPASRPARG